MPGCCGPATHSTQESMTTDPDREGHSECVCGGPSPSHSKGLGSRAWPLTAESPLTSAGLSQAWERSPGRGRVSGRTLSRLQGPGCGNCLVASGPSSFDFSRFSLCTEAAGGQPSRPAVLEDGACRTQAQRTGGAWNRRPGPGCPGSPASYPGALCPAASVQETDSLGHQPRTPHR